MTGVGGADDVSNASSGGKAANCSLRKSRSVRA